MGLRADMDKQEDHRTEMHAADRLLQEIDRVGAPVCVGIDPVFERLPKSLQDGGWMRAHQARAIGVFSREVVAAVADHVPCVKVQAACFERYGSDGWREMEEVIGTARRAGLIVILDAKRGDIGISAEHYAAATFDAGDASVDWITINAYLGADGIEPFLKGGGGAFSLVRTSNPGSDRVQSAKLATGESVSEHFATMVSEIGLAHIGQSGFSALGAVVGATKREDIAKLRAIMPEQIFLVPGFGAQGGGIDDVLPCFREDGRGAIVTASRSVIYPFDPSDQDWKDKVRRAAIEFAKEMARALQRRPA